MMQGAMRAYEEQGFVLLSGLVPAETVVAARREYERLYDNALTRLPDGPTAVFWHHVEGGAKRFIALANAPALAAIISHPSVTNWAKEICGGPVRLLETIIFNKPPQLGTSLAWHHDVSFFPFQGGIVCSAMVMLDASDEENGGTSFAVGSHKGGDISAVDLHTGERRGNDPRPVPTDPGQLGYEIVTPTITPGDVVMFDGRVWHGSGPNRSRDRQRRLLSIRYLSLDAIYRPIPGNAATFMQQITSAVGEPLSGHAFPLFS